MQSAPFFSVVIPLYNKENYIKETLQSIIQQSFNDFEVIIVDDGSTDKSVIAAKEFSDPRIRIISQVNGGVSKARNTGIQNSTAEYIAFLDADDLWQPNFLEEIYSLIIENPNAGLFGTAYVLQKENGDERSINIKGLPKGFTKGIVPSFFKVMASGDNFVWTSATCIRKSIFFDQNIWFPVGEKYGEDQYVWAAVAIKNQVAYSIKECAIYKIEAENNTIGGILEEVEPHKSFYMIRDLRSLIIGRKIKKDFDCYLSKIFYQFPLRNMLYRNKFYGLKQLLSFSFIAKHYLILLTVFFTPRKLILLLKNKQ